MNLPKEAGILEYLIGSTNPLGMFVFNMYEYKEIYHKSRLESVFRKCKIKKLSKKASQWSKYESIFNYAFE